MMSYYKKETGLASIFVVLIIFFAVSLSLVGGASIRYLVDKKNALPKEVMVLPDSSSEPPPSDNNGVSVEPPPRVPIVTHPSSVSRENFYDLGSMSGAVSASAGTVATAIVPFDTNTRVYGVVMRMGATASFRLLDPKGREIALSSLEKAPAAPDTDLFSFEIDDPPEGNITVELAAKSSAAQIDFGFYFNNFRRLVTYTEPVSLEPGQAITILAHLQDGDGKVIIGSNPSFSASVLLPFSSQIESISLFDDGKHLDKKAGDGIFGGEFTATARGGRYVFQTEGRATIHGEVVARSSEGIFPVIPNTVEFVGVPSESTLDSDGDGLFNALVFELKVSILVPSLHLELFAELFDSAGKRIPVRLLADLSNAQPGEYTMTLKASGPEIVRHGINGPWMLKNITLYDYSADSLPVATAPDYQTAVYSISMFDSPSPPKISTFLPGSGSLAGGYAVVLHGLNFLDVQSVKIGVANAQFVVTGDDTIAVTIPALSAAMPGLQPTTDVSVEVIVISPWGVEVAKNAWTYRVPP
jgi:hypothetical protein